MKINLVFIILVGVILRVLFLLFGAEYLYGSEIFTTNDSFSYTESFLNFFNHGVYTHTMGIESAKFGRMPGYPFFWGLHYLIFGGKYVYIAVSITQLILNSISIYLIYKIVIYVTKNHNKGLAAAAIYAIYPFIILWIPKSSTELLGEFLTILYIYILFRPNLKNRFILLGLTLGTMVLTRPYLGIMILLPAIYFLKPTTFKIYIKNMLVFGFSFALVYSCWPIRNYVSHNQIVLTKPLGAGYPFYQEDMNSFRSFTYAWSDKPLEFDQILDSVLYTTNEIKWPEKSDLSDDSRKELNYLVEQCRECGSSFLARRDFIDDRIITPNCNVEIKTGMDKLTKEYKNKNPIKYWLNPAKYKLKKAFTGPTDQNIVTSVLLFFRSIMVLFGFLYGIYYFRKKEIICLILFPAFMYLFIVFIIRQVEMRYLIQADTLLLILFCLFLTELLKKKKIIN